MVRVVVFHQWQFSHTSTTLIDAQRKLSGLFTRPCNTMLQCCNEATGPSHTDQHRMFPSKHYTVQTKYLTPICRTYAYKHTEKLTNRPTYISACPHAHAHTHTHTMHYIPLKRISVLLARTLAGNGKSCGLSVGITPAHTAACICTIIPRTHETSLCALSTRRYLPHNISMTDHIHDSYSCPHKGYCYLVT
jgi:hypothetical protein